MGAVARMSSKTVIVQPGETATVTLTIRNTGTVVDQFSCQVLGDAAEWSFAEPPRVSLFPDAEATVQITFAPPRLASVKAGRLPFAVRAASAEDPAGSTVEEGTVDVGAFSDVVIELVPRTCRGRRTGRTQLVVDNRSNVSYQGEASGLDPEMSLEMTFRPPVVDVPPGGVSFARVLLRPKHRFWRGPSKPHAFTVLLKEPLPLAPPALPFTQLGVPGAPAGGPGAPPGPGQFVPPAGQSTLTLPEQAPSTHPSELPTEGTMVQDALIPSWLLKALLVLLALIILAIILWFVLLKPTINSAAQNEVTKQLKAAGITPAHPAPAVSTPSSATPTTAAPSGTPTPTTVPTSTNYNGSLIASGNGTVTYTVPNGKTLEITDLVVQNAAGDTGTVSLNRGGTVLIQWSMADFRDLDYHWITPITMTSGEQLNLVTSGCTDACTPGVYFAGTQG